MTQIYEAHWTDTDRAVLTHLDMGKGCVIVDIIKNHRISRFPKGSALIWNLYIYDGGRGRGIGRSLLERAEAYCREKGVEYAYLEWDARDTPRWVRDWYERLGYELKALNMRDSHRTYCKPLAEAEHS